MALAAIVLDAPEPRTLGSFYERLLGWTVVDDQPTWVGLQHPSGRPSLSFQLEPEFVAPVWPSTEEHQQMSAHLDIVVDDLEAAVAWACQVGATVAEHQPQADVRVMLDPAGHPFCLFPGPVDPT